MLSQGETEQLKNCLLFLQGPRDFSGEMLSWSGGFREHTPLVPPGTPRPRGRQETPDKQVTETKD